MPTACSSRTEETPEGGVPSIQGIFLSVGHAYFGHFGGPAGTDPTVAVAEAEAVAGRGLVGDRFFGYKDNYKGQVTLMAAEVVEELGRHAGRTNLTGAELRRNLVVAGIDLPGLIGRRFRLQGVELEGTEECRPCVWMDQAVGPGSEAWLRGRGGLRCRILSDGRFRVGAAGLEVLEAVAPASTALPAPVR